VGDDPIAAAEWSCCVAVDVDESFAGVFSHAQLYRFFARDMACYRERDYRTGSGPQGVEATPDTTKRPRSLREAGAGALVIAVSGRPLPEGPQQDDDGVLRGRVVPDEANKVLALGQGRRRCHPVNLVCRDEPGGG
jgi:hypothetical protein